jgi:hypothetical protein
MKTKQASLFRACAWCHMSRQLLGVPGKKALKAASLSLSFANTRCLSYKKGIAENTTVIESRCYFFT